MPSSKILDFLLIYFHTECLCVGKAPKSSPWSQNLSLWGDNSHGIFQVTFILVRMLTEFITAEIYFGSCDAQQDFTEAHCIQCDVIEITSQCGLGLRMQMFSYPTAVPTSAINAIGSTGNRCRVPDAEISCNVLPLKLHFIPWFNLRCLLV